LPAGGTLRGVTEGAKGLLAGGFAADGVPANYQRYLAPVVFEPWARLLVERAGVMEGHVVLDVASGTGVAAREAARVAGPRGLVIASDLNGPMIARAAVQPVPAGAAPVRFIEAPAQALPSDDESFDVVLCQQGLQFFGDHRGAAVAEWNRVLQTGGVAAASVWAAGHRIEPFDSYSEAAADAGLEPPFSGAFDAGTFAMPGETIGDLFEAGGFAAVDVSTVELEVRWATVGDAVAGIYGSVFGSLVAGLDEAGQAQIRASLADRFAADAPDGSVSRPTVAAVVVAVR
jgi:SAM-dependent methyltransferase